MHDLTPIRQEVDQFLYDFQVVEIENPEQYTKAGDMLKQLKNKIKKLEDKRKEYTKPLLDQKKLIDGDFKGIIKPLEEFVDKVKESMLVFHKAEQERKDKEQAELDKKALESGQSETKVEVVNDIKTQRGDVSTTTVKKVWTYEVEDENLLPREYMKPDETKISKAVREGVREIKGVKIYQKESLSIR